MKVLNFLPFLLAPLAVSAQQTSGTVTYEQSLALDIKGENLPEGLADLIKKQKSESVLYFNPVASIYQDKEKSTTEPEDYKSGNMNIIVSRSSDGEQYYSDFNNKKSIQQKSLMGKTFLVNAPLEYTKWKFSGRQKKILDLPCMEAININGTDTVTAWYTTAIPVSSGPMIYGGLPGLILELNIGKQLNLVANKIEPADSKTQNLIKAPTKGKKISNEDYNKLALEKAKEMEKEFGRNGNGNVIIKTIGR